MSILENLPPEDQARIDAAVTWRRRLLDNPVLELSTEYLDWISDPANGRVFNAVEAALEAVNEVASAPEMLDLRRAALNHARYGLPRGRFSTHTALKIAAAVVLAVGIGGGALTYYLRLPGDYTTSVGERRIVALPDGSRIALDSDSEVHVAYSANARAIQLDRGRARFDVAHDVTRPFVVTAGTESVVAVGTSFDVERLGSKVLVTLIQGRVVVKGAPTPVAAVTPTPPVTLTAGEQMVASTDVKPTVAAVNIPSATAWETGRLVFQDESLSEAVAQVNRYTDKPIAVDPSVASIRINGVFNAGDVGSFVSAVTSYFPVQASTDTDNNIVLQRRS
jgi:transmembrane sensor